MKAWPGYERQAEIATQGLLAALHGNAAGEDVGQLVKEMRERLPSEIALRVIEALEAKASVRESKLLQEVGGLGRLAWKRPALRRPGSGRHVHVCLDSRPSCRRRRGSPLR